MPVTDIPPTPAPPADGLRGGARLPAQLSPQTEPKLGRNLCVTLIIFGLGAAALLTSDLDNHPTLHTVLDTTVFLLRGVLALLLWEIGSRTHQSFARLLALTFAIASLCELLHTLTGIEWSGHFAWIQELSDWLRPATWGPPVHLMIIGTGGAVWFSRRDRQHAAMFALGLVVVTGLLFVMFHTLPRYTSPGWLGITRPALILAPPLWVAVGLYCWRLGDEDRIARAIALMAVLFVAGHVAMLYSRAPHDTAAMIAHLGKCTGCLFLLMSLMQMGAADMAQRIQAERELAQMNAELEQRVRLRTSELEASNMELTKEISSREQAEQKLQTQLARLNLLHQITRAIGERQDLQSIFQVMIRTVEEHLPVDFGCVCLHDATSHTLKVTSVGIKSQPLALELAMPEQATIAIDENGLSRCVRGQLVYEPDLGPVRFPFPQRLAGGGLRALVAAPLRVESSVFGVVIAARRETESFSSTDCEFLRQLSEHVALAANQAQLYSALQRAYDDLRETQQAIMQQERLRALGQMASGIAHDINNAISPASLYVESMLEKEPNLSARGREQLDTVQRALDDVAQTVARMREFYRQREPQMSLAPVHVNRLVQQVLDLTRARWSDMPQQRGIVIELRTELATNLPAIMGVESEIREALINLVFNAVDAMTEGGTLTLRTSVTASGIATAEAGPQHVRIEVTDTGAGMDEDTRRRCLEPFFTTKGERGTGLGLAMVYGTVQRHSADLEIESAVGHGTTMRLSFAVTSASVSAVSSVDALHPPERLRVLIVDDDPVLLKSLRDILESDGHVITTANGGQAGIDTFKAAVAINEPFAAVITDLGMPHVDGRKVAGAVKSVSPGTPLLLLTGWGQRLVAEGDIPAHVDRMLAKPPKLRELREALAQCGARAGRV